MKTVKILSIGNSFSQDAHAYLHQIFQSVGIDSLCWDLIIGGCPLELHHKNIKENNRNYSLEVNGIKSKRPVSIEEAADLFNWDVITNQQASRFSGLPETFEPYLGEILDYFKEKSPESRMLLHKTWTYDRDYETNWFSYYDGDQDKMQSMIDSTFDMYSKKYGLDLIPSSEIVQALRSMKEFDYENGGLRSTAEGLHLNVPYGRFAVAIGWANVIAGVKPEEVKFVPEGADAELCEKIKLKLSDILR